MRSDTYLGHLLREPSSMYSLSTDGIGTAPMSLGFLFVCLFGTVLALSQDSAYLPTQASFGKVKGSNSGYVLKWLKTDCCCEWKRTHELYKLPLSTFHAFQSPRRLF